MGNYQQESNCMSEAPPLSEGEGLGVRPNKQITASTKKLLKRIRKCEAKIENLKTLPYYTVFKLHGQQQKDIEGREEVKQFATCLPAGRSQYSAAVSLSA